MSLEDRLYPFLSLYERLPRRVKWTAGFAYRKLPESLRLGRTFGEFRDLARQAEDWSLPQVSAYQLEHLRRTLLHARDTCPYYRRSFAEAGFRPESVQSPGDLIGCPFVEKRHLLEHLPELVSGAYPPRARLYITTGGSTGVPVGFYLQKGISRPKERAFLEAAWSRGGYFYGARLAVLRGSVTSSSAGGRIASYDATRDWLMLSSYHLTPARLPEYIEAIEAFGPDLLYCYPSSALHLAQLMEWAGRVWGIPLKGVLCSSERLTRQQQRLLEDAFQCRVYQWYGHSERVVLAGAGRQSDLLYFWPQYGHVEFGPPDAEGLREVIGTSFHNMVMPLVRYKTGDYVRVVEESDGTPARELPWPAIAEVAGREQEFLVSGSGRQIPLAAFNMHSDVFDGLYAVQFYQEQPGVAELRYVAGPRFHETRLQAIEAAVRYKLGDDFRVVLRGVADTEKTTRGKHRWLISRLAKRGADG